MLRIAVLLIFIPFIGTAQHRQVKKKDLKNLAAIMAGEFSSEEQSLRDTSFFHITLRMTPFWEKNKNGYWLYVEQAVAKMQDKPYRQRVYHLYIADDSTIVSKVFELKNPKQYIGAWKNSENLKIITSDSLIDRQGCGIYLHKNSDGNFTGSTPGKECLSSLRGATYATSQVTIYPKRIESWDRGWDSQDKQVWGAVKSGYIFLKSN